MRSSVTITFSGAAYSVLRVDGRALRFDGPDSTVQLPPGPHALTWYVEDAPGTDFDVEIVRPDEARWTLTPSGRVSETGRAAGDHLFRVE
ncbi:MAG: hypothetical protein M3068_06225 [Gemmatimonadota bacterium]|jgi:hypothetical protein|nr:hypothetical protein [Gemmatimonadota bacterium]